MRGRGRLRLGVLIPCRDEGKVIERRILNLAHLEWPLGAKAPHRLVIVDDGSRDGSATFARSLLASAFAGRPEVEARVVANRHRPGKTGAIRTGLEELGEVDVIVLGDADVLFGSGSLLAIEEAFARQPALGMGCGRQHFFAQLPPDGRTDGLHTLGAGPCAGFYDRWTAWLRRLESRTGRLFSVHGQCLAWRAELGLMPRAGIAADDLDLALQLRGRVGEHGRWRLALLDGVDFFERKLPAGATAQGQALRRARAFVQVLRRSRAPRGDWIARVQWWLYRSLPLYAAELFFGATTLVLVGGLWFFGARAWWVASLLGLGLLLLPPGRDLIRMLLLIRSARRQERHEPLPDRWEMRRS